MNTLVLYSGLFAASALYALALEVVQRRWPQIEPDLTWVEVVVGVALVGGFVRWHLAIEPWLSGHDVWWAWTGGFVVAGIPVIVWQLYQTMDRMQDAGRERNGSSGPAAVAEERGEAPSGDS